MATMEATRLRVADGGHEALLDVLRRLETYIASFGPAVRLRVREWYVTEQDSGEISTQLIFPDARIRAAVLDEIRRDGVANPLERALRATRPPAAVRQRVWLDTLDEDAPSPPNREVIAYSVFVETPHREEEAHAAFLEADKQDRRLGADAELWVIRYAGASLGHYVRGMSFDSFEELRAFDELSATAKLTVPPIQQAINEGVLRRVAGSLTTWVRLD
jgi:hypothetical protein